MYIYIYIDIHWSGALNVRDHSAHPCNAIYVNYTRFYWVGDGIDIDCWLDMHFHPHAYACIQRNPHFHAQWRIATDSIFSQPQLNLLNAADTMDGQSPRMYRLQFICAANRWVLLNVMDFSAGEKGSYSPSEYASIDCARVMSFFHPRSTTGIRMTSQSIRNHNIFFLLQMQQPHVFAINVGGVNGLFVPNSSQFIYIFTQ